MRRLSYLLLVVLTWYLAGMYRSIPLTALFLTEMVLFVLLAVQTLMFRLTLKVDFSTGWSAGEKGAECPCRVRVRNRGIFPAGRFRLTLQLSYPDGKKKLVRSIYAGAEGHQTTEMEFSILPACCGMIKVELRQIEVYDYLAMFSLSARLKGQMRTAVFPAARTLRIQRPAAPQRWNDLSGTQVLPRKGTSSEVSGLREYHPGDPARRIHWKQSAHTDRLWLREYEQELHGRVYLTLHLPEDTPVEVEIWDAFYEILSALTAGLLEQAAETRNTAGTLAMRRTAGKFSCTCTTIRSAWGKRFSGNFHGFHGDAKPHLPTVPLKKILPEQPLKRMLPAQFRERMPEQSRNRILPERSTGGTEQFPGRISI